MGAKPEGSPHSDAALMMNGESTIAGLNRSDRIPNLIRHETNIRRVLRNDDGLLRRFAAAKKGYRRSSGIEGSPDWTLTNVKASEPGRLPNGGSTETARRVGGERRVGDR